MAKSSDKRRLEENAAHLRQLQIIIAVSNLVYLGVRLGLKRATWGGAHSAGLAFTTLSYAASYWIISLSLAPHYGAGGELVYAGGDAKAGGVLSYWHDLLYIAAFVQVLGAFTDWAWLAFLAVPLYGAYQLWGVVSPLLSGGPKPAAAVESEADRKRREKRERQEARAQKFARK